MGKKRLELRLDQEVLDKLEDMATALGVKRATYAAMILVKHAKDSQIDD